MFEGKVIDFYTDHGIVIKAKVVACVKDIGITIVGEENPNFYCCCLVMKNSPKFGIRYRGAITQTNKYFTEIRKMIMSGVVDLRKLNAEFNPSAASSAMCPFND